MGPAKETGASDDSKLYPDKVRQLLPALEWLYIKNLIIIIIMN
jgi:hypothetical protein